MDGVTDRRTDGQTEIWKDRQTDGDTDRWTARQTDGLTDGRTDGGDEKIAREYRFAKLHFKKCKNEYSS